MTPRLVKNPAIPSNAPNPMPWRMCLTLPAEIIYHIICFVGPLELIQLRMVSKQYHAIINDRSVWRTVYQNARLPRPPGPFHWQSTRFLQRSLVRSARVAQSWTSQPMKVVSSRQVFHQRNFTGKYCWVGKRWRFVRTNTEIVSQDVDTGCQQPLWDSGSISSWAACSVVCAHGHFVYLVLRETTGDHRDLVKLVEFRVDDESGQLSEPVASDVPLRCFSRCTHLRVVSTNAPFVYISVDPRDEEQHHTRVLIFDVRSQIFYEFPRFISRLDELDPSSVSWDPCGVETLLTTTHIVVASMFKLGNNVFAQVLQAFVIPDDPCPDDEGICMLRLSHETIRHGTPTKLSLLRDSVVNSVDGSTTLRFLHSFKFKFFCTELTLPRSRTNSVVRMSLKEHQVLEIKIADGHRGDSMLAFDGGFGRGLCIITFKSGGTFKHHLYKFAVDVSEERTSVEFGRNRSSSVAGVEVFDMQSEVHWFDGVRGRMCYTKDSDDIDGDIDSRVTVIVDLL